MPITIEILSIYSAISLVVHVLGIANAGHAVINVRSSRGAIAWGISSIAFPWLAIPLYWIFSKTRFRGYREAISRAYYQRQNLVSYADDEILKFKAQLPQELATVEKLVSSIGDLTLIIMPSNC